MNMHTHDENIQNLRSKVRAEMAVLAELENELTDQHLKQLLKPAWNTLRDLNNYFLDVKVLKRPRTATVLAIWLSHAEASLQFAIERRKFVENLIEAFGLGIRSIPA
jgi:hypothetical protein